jgi:hypothetical protein
LAFALALGCASSLRGGANDDLPSIFNGRSFAGWTTPDPNPFWKAVDGVIVGENNEAKTGSMLWTEQIYRDFVIECEARWTGEIDSGIIFREPQLQMQIGVSRSLKRDLTASFYVGGKEKYPETGQARNPEKLLKPGDWNKFRLEARGDTFTVWLNGEQVVKYTNAKYTGAGPIGLQIHGGLAMKVEFRNLRAKELK